MEKLQVELNAEDKDLVEKLLLTGHIKHKYAQRLRTVLLRARGRSK